MNIMGVGGLELLVILVVAMLVLGPARLASTARVLGRLTRELRRGAEDLPRLLEELAGEEQSPSDDEEESSEPSGSQPRRRRRPRQTRDQDSDGPSPGGE
jgi:Sec-independent protein translocase protein TatA